MIKQIIVIFITGLILISCKSKSNITKHSPKNADVEMVGSAKSIGNYNADSSYCIYTSPPINNNTSELLSIIVTTTSVNDTVFYSNKEYNLVKWINDSVIMLRKIRGIERSLRKTPITESTKISTNYSDTFYNCKSRNFISKSTPNSLMP